MNLYHLRYFVTLAHMEHYTKAAEALLITQPSLSHAIATLEDELGIRLFEKVGRNIRLTKYGQSFLEDTEASLRILDSGINNMKMTGAGEGVIELAFLRTLGIRIVPKLVKDFLAANPGRSIHFNFSTDSGLSPDLVAGVKSKKYDLAFCSKMEKEPSVEFVPFASQELVVIVPTDHPLAQRDSVHLAETLPYPHILFKHKSGLRPIIDGIFSKIGAMPEVIYEMEEDQVVAGFVAQGFGIAVVPKMALLDNINVKILYIDYPKWERNFYVATMKDAYRAPIVEEFRQFAIENAQL